jgi:GNAT superfamily N-acetyltransferase
VNRGRAWREEAITRHHRRDLFDCGVPALNDYLRRFARQNHESGGAKTFVAVPVDAPADIAGYYSISPASVEQARVPELVTRKIARYDVPVFRLARLAVALTYQGHGLGAKILLSAGERALAVAAMVGGVALLIDAKDDRAAAWYVRFGAVPLLDTPRTLILPLGTIAKALVR